MIYRLLPLVLCFVFMADAALADCALPLRLMPRLNSEIVPTNFQFALVGVEPEGAIRYELLDENNVLVETNLEIVAEGYRRLVPTELLETGVSYRLIEYLEGFGQGEYPAFTADFGRDDTAPQDVGVREFNYRVSGNGLASLDPFPSCGPVETLHNYSFVLDGDLSDVDVVEVRREANSELIGASFFFARTLYFTFSESIAEPFYLEFVDRAGNRSRSSVLESGGGCSSLKVSGAGFPFGIYALVFLFGFLRRPRGL